MVRKEHSETKTKQALSECIILKQVKNLQKGERGAFDYQYDHNREVLFAQANDKRRVTTGISFETILL
jgi:hypothetical protein